MINVRVLSNQASNQLNQKATTLDHRIIIPMPISGNQSVGSYRGKWDPV